MKRKIISIDENRCTGCGQCIPDCPEGAIQLIEGKARLVSDLFCDGLGACIGTCPEGAISVIEREAGAYDETAVMERIVAQGPAVIRAHLEHLQTHGETRLLGQAVGYLEGHGLPVPPGYETTHASAGQGVYACNPFAGCPGAAPQLIRKVTGTRKRPVDRSEDTGSELRQWPVQLRLLDPRSPFFDGADLLIAADCVPFAHAGFHREFLHGKTVIIFCPKLDADIEGYISKLADILSLHNIRSVTVVRMEVPCCGGTRYVLNEAMKRAGKELPVSEHVVTLQGGAA
jgi:NAD-dependent dihydropyrimidine dehydrogenase PreA subunit